MRPAVLALVPPVLLAGLALSAYAADVRQVNRGGATSLSVGAFAGGHVFAEGTSLGVVGGSDNPDGAKNAVLGGLRVSLGLGRWFVAEAELAGIPTEDRLYQRKARVLGYRINALAFLMSGRFRPFVLLGAGALQVASSDAQGEEGLARDTKAEVHTGIGFDCRILGAVSVRADARVLQVPSKQSWGLVTDVEAMLGATVRFGGGEPSPPPAGGPSALPVARSAERTVATVPEPVPDPPAESVAATAADKQAGQDAAAASRTETPTFDAGSELIVASLAADPLPAHASVETSAARGAVAPLARLHSVGDLLGRAGEIRFESGSPKLAGPSLAFLDELAAALAREPAARLRILVHTADSGDAKRDLAFSRRRAEAVKWTLVVKGAGVDQLLSVGRGSEDPIAPNLTRTGRMRNQRVELHRDPSLVSGP
jgi:outer membrane protein OmpA-like peptidoglycan-associated protein